MSDELQKSEVIILWDGDAADAHGAESRYGGIEWVAEFEDRIVLVPSGGVEEPPRVTIYRDNIVGFHETAPDTTDDD